MKFVVDPPELHNASQKFFSLSGEYTSVYTRLLNTAGAMGEAWRASDNLAFVEQINGFCQELKDMANHLEQASGALKQQAINYETTRDNNTLGVKTLAN